MLKNPCKKHGRIRKGLVVFSVFIVCVLVSTSMVFAASGNRKDYSADALVKSGLFRNASNNYSLDTSGSEIEIGDYKAGSVQSIGFAELYGGGSRSFTYKGEAPKGETDDAFENYKDIPHESDGWITKEKGKEIYRVWVDQPQKLHEGLNWTESSTSDIHAANLYNASDFPIVADIGRSFVSMIYGGAMALSNLFLNLVRLATWLVNIDIYSLFKGLVGEDGLPKLISEALIGTSFGSFSPIFVIAMVVFVFGLLSIMFRRLKGDESFQPLISEFVIMIVSMVLVAISLNGGYGTIMEKTGEFVQNVTKSVTMSSGGDMNLFSYSTGDAMSDIAKTEASILSKANVDAIIKSNFGVSVDELYLWKDDDPEYTQKTWGISSQQMKDLVTKLNWYTDNYGQNLLTVYTGTGSGANNEAQPNLGYFAYAALSGVDTRNPLSNSNGTLVVNKIPAKQVAFVPDLLAAIDAEADGSPHAQQIMEYLDEPSFDVVGMLLAALAILMTATAIALPVAYCLVSKLFFSVGLIFIPVVPLLLLVRSTRQHGYTLLYTWLYSALRMAVAQILVIMIIFISGTILSVSSFGTFLDIVVMSVLMLAAPKMIASVNNAVDSVGGRNHQFAPVAAANRWLSNMATTNGVRKQIGRRVERARQIGEDAKRLDKATSQDMPMFDDHVGEELVEVGESAIDKYGLKFGSSKTSTNTPTNDDGSTISTGSGNSSIESGEDANDLLNRAQYDANGNPILYQDEKGDVFATESEARALNDSDKSQINAALLAASQKLGEMEPLEFDKVRPLIPSHISDDAVRRAIKWFNADLETRQRTGDYEKHRKRRRFASALGTKFRQTGALLGVPLCSKNKAILAFGDKVKGFAKSAGENLNRDLADGGVTEKTKGLNGVMYGLSKKASGIAVSDDEKLKKAIDKRRDREERDRLAYVERKAMKDNLLDVNSELVIAARHGAFSRIPIVGTFFSSAVNHGDKEFSMEEAKNAKLGGTNISLKKKRDQQYDEVYSEPERVVAEISKKKAAKKLTRISIEGHTDQNKRNKDVAPSSVRGTYENGKVSVGGKPSSNSSNNNGGSSSNTSNSNNNNSTSSTSSTSSNSSNSNSSSNRSNSSDKPRGGGIFSRKTFKPKPS